MPSQHIPQPIICAESRSPRLFRRWELQLPRNRRKENRASARHFPSLWHSHSWPCSLLCVTAIPGCAPLSAPGVHRDSVRLQPGISPLCGTATPGCAPIFIFSTVLVAPGFSPAFPPLWHSHSWLCSDLHLLDCAKKPKKLTMKWVA